MLAGALSSGLGLRGFFGIWAISIAGDFVFIATTLGAFVATAFIPSKQWYAAAPAGFLLHWVGYAFSWMVTVAGAKEGDIDVGQSEPFGFVLAIGWIGLLWCAIASPLLGLAAERLGRSMAQGRRQGQ